MKRLLVLSVPLLTAQAPAPADIDAIKARIAAFPQARQVEAVEAYAPAETVHGAMVKGFDRAPTGAIAADALDRAEAYAASQNSYALIVARDGRIVRERYWGGFGPVSRFSTASMHKSVMALAYGPAVARGLIRLDDPVGKYLTEWRTDPRGKITVRQLLQMASGLKAPVFSTAPDSPSVAMTFAADIGKVALSLPQGTPPGSEFSYANANSQIAGLILERATGVRYADWLSRHIWRPVGAADATLWLDREGGSPHYFCCLQASARDWVRVGELIRNKGRVDGRQVIGSGWITEMAKPSATNPNYGLQMWRGSPYAPVRRYSKESPLVLKSAAPFAAEDVLFFDGAGAQRVYIVPSVGLTVVRIGKPAYGWDDTAMVNMILSGVAR